MLAFCLAERGKHRGDDLDRQEPIRLLRGLMEVPGPMRARAAEFLMTLTRSNELLSREGEGIARTGPGTCGHQTQATPPRPR